MATTPGGRNVIQPRCDMALISDAMTGFMGEGRWGSVKFHVNTHIRNVNVFTGSTC